MQVKLDSAAILNFSGHIEFSGHMVIEIEFLDPKNLLLDIFLYFLCQYLTVVNKCFDMLAAILDFGGHFDIF